MKKICIFLAASLFAFGCDSTEQQQTTTASPAALNLSEYVLTDIPGSDVKRAAKRSPEGKLLSEGMVRNGKRNGIWVDYHSENESPKVVANYVDAAFNGPYFEYSAQGQVTLVCSYVTNVLDGRFIRYKLSRKTEEGYYKNGQLDGLYKKYYPNKDLVQQEINYKAGKLHGSNKFLDESGNVMVQYEYEIGEKISGGIVEVKK